MNQDSSRLRQLTADSWNPNSFTFYPHLHQLCWKHCGQARLQRLMR